MQPPQLIAAFYGSKTIRFYLSGGSAATITMQLADFQDLITIASAAAVGWRGLDSIRIRKIEMWASAVAGGNTALLLEEMQSSASFLMSSKSRVMQDMVVGSARAAHILYKPTPGTIQSNWISANVSASVNILKITAPANAVLDLTFDYTFADGNSAPTAVATAIAGAVAGQVYCRALGVATSTAWQPLGLATI
jgi:hypothetical protein